LAILVTDEDARALEMLGQFPPYGCVLPPIDVHHVGRVDVEPAEQPFGFEFWMDGANMRAQSWFDRQHEMAKAARHALGEGQCVRILPVREVISDAAAVA
jgi:hypothetical protein